MPHHDESSVARMLERLVELDLLRPLDDTPGYEIPRWAEHQYVYPSWTPAAQADRRARRRATDDRAMTDDMHDHNQALIKSRSSRDQAVHNAAQRDGQRHDATSVLVHAFDDVSRVRASARPRPNPLDATARDADEAQLEPSVRPENSHRDAANDGRAAHDDDQAMIKRRSSRDQASASDDQRKNKNKNKNENKNTITYLHDSLRAERSASRARQPDPLFEALVESVYGRSYTEVELTRSERGRVNEAVKQLREIGADAESVREKASLYRARWPGVELTPTALVKHWHLLEAAPTQPSLAVVPRIGANGRRSSLEIALATLQELAGGKGG
jgi:hypothetical protein